MQAATGYGCGMDELRVIAALRRSGGKRARGVVLGSGDDAALLRFGKGPVLATIDTMVEGVHFRRNDLSPEEMKSVPSMPASLDEALDCLEEDHDFLLKGDVFTEELIETYIRYKRINEAEAVRLRPHPYEFALYYDI